MKRLFWLKIHTVALILFLGGMIGLMVWWVTHKDTQAMIFWWGWMMAILCVKINAWLESKSGQNTQDHESPEHGGDFK